MKSAPIPAGFATDTCAQQRYLDDGRTFYAFLFDGCDVVCPKCKAHARVGYRQDDEPWRWSARFRCARCACSADASSWALYNRRRLPDDAAWFGPVVATGSRACAGCGLKWITIERRLTRWQTHLPTTIDAQCGRCGRSQQVVAHWTANADIACGIEPAFGLPLAWREPCRNGREIWVFGPKHLLELRRYVRSTLRERECNHNRSYFMRLPAWIKSAKHRTDVLAAIGRIEKRILDGER